MGGSMCMLIFIRISAVMLCGWQKKSCNFTEILKAKKFHVICQLIRYFFTILYNLVLLKQNIRTSLNSKTKRSVLENQRESPKIKSLVPDLSEKITACIYSVCSIS